MPKPCAVRRGTVFFCFPFLFSDEEKSVNCNGCGEKEKERGDAQALRRKARYGFLLFSFSFFQKKRKKERDMTDVYTTVEHVLLEIPGSVPEALTTEKIQTLIEDASRFVDARLSNYAGFADINAVPPTPSLIEKITRLIAAYECMVFMGETRADEHGGAQLKELAEKLLDDLNPADGSCPRAFLPPDEYDYSQSPVKESVRFAERWRPKALYFAPIKRSPYGEHEREG